MISHVGVSLNSACLIFITQLEGVVEAFVKGCQASTLIFSNDLLEVALTLKHYVRVTLVEDRGHDLDSVVWSRLLAQNPLRVAHTHA